MHAQVDIMMPVFNGMPMLKASVKSVLVQNYTNWHCIILDDGSTDDTWQFLQTLKDDHRFTILRNPHNMGRGISRQRILEASQATYICMLDAGDMMHPDRIALQVEYLDTHPEVGIVSSAMLSFGTHTQLLRVRGYGNGLINRYAGNGSVCFAPSMFRTSIARTGNVSFGTLGQCEDTHFLTRYYQVNPFYHSLPQPLYYYNEFDDQSRLDLLVSYLQIIHISLRPFNPRAILLSLAKFIVTLAIFPFISMEKRVAKRGREATPDEIAEFDRHVKPLIRTY